MSTAASPLLPIPTLSFRLKSPPPSSKFSARLGQLWITRPDHDRDINIEVLTPGLIASTTRGIIKHLSRDNVRRTSCVKWVHVPFESFDSQRLRDRACSLQVDPPIPTQQKCSYPLHVFLGFSPSQHLVSLSLRDPADGREMPPNGKLFVAAHSSRGARLVTCSSYRSYVTATLPDVVFSMSDVPFNSPPHSQKRISKSIERSAQWLTTLLAPLNLSLATRVLDRPTNTSANQNLSPAPVPRLNVFVHMVGGLKPSARSAFAAALLEPLEPKEKKLAQLDTLDEGVSGYVFDLVPLRTALLAERADNTASTHLSYPWPSTDHGSLTDSFAPLIRASLQDLPETKPRLVNTAYSPHEMLRLICDAGIDLFDTFWAQQAATWGVALDFRFPVQAQRQAASEPTEKYQIGHNLYEERYARDFTSLADSFMGGLEYLKRQHGQTASSPIGGSPAELAMCPCAACSPTWLNEPLIHSTADDAGTTRGVKELASPYTRAYLHHLLHTHEMSAHALLVMHNLTVMDAFMCGVRAVLERDRALDVHACSGSHADEVMAPESGESPNKHRPTLFAAEVVRFERSYDARLQVLDEAKACWEKVDLARGKGRLARERAKASGDVV